VKMQIAVMLIVTCVCLPSLQLRGQETLDIGSRLEPLLDDFLLQRLDGDARFRLHKPQPREVVLVADQPWEGNTSAYYTVFQDGDRYRMYYRGSHYDAAARRAAHAEVTCYVESRDGIRWEKPELGLHEFQGSTRNNIVWTGAGTHNFTPFKDENPAAPPESRYKALAGGSGGLVALQSADGVRWNRMRDKPVITQGAFDSQNLAFWDPHAKLYREYHRAFRGVRDIMTGTSDDFLTWTNPVFLEYPDAPQEHLYTNAVMPYPGAAHVLIGFPTRFLPTTQQVEPTLMTSRDGRVFRRWTDALIPLTAPEERDGNRSNYMGWGLVQLPASDAEWSVYATEAYYTGPDSRVRRFAYRAGGLVSIRADQDGGLLTKPLRFTGDCLVLNYQAADAGHIRVEIQDGKGRPVPGFELERCQVLTGDSLAAPVRWQDAPDLAALQGKPIVLRFDLRRADLYSLQFR
jgi:hypothetical protein